MTTVPHNFQAANLPEADVINAFKTVKIKLFDEGVLSHFNTEIAALNIQFNDNSSSTRDVTQWHYLFGDNQTSNEQNPVHTYNTAGSYQVTLTVTDQNNHQDTFIRTLMIENE